MIRRAFMRLSPRRGVGLTPIVELFALGLLASACSSVCDEVAEEAEANGCAKGVLPEDGDDGEEELTTCEGAREARAHCYLDLTQNVCAMTEDESAALIACIEAAQNSPTE